MWYTPHGRGQFMRINDYYEHLRKQGYGINENTKTTDFPFDVTEDFRNFG